MKIVLMILILMMIAGCAITGEDYYYYGQSYATPPYYPSYYNWYENPAFYDFSYGLDWPFYSGLFSGPFYYNNYYGYHHWEGSGWNGGWSSSSGEHHH